MTQADEYIQGLIVQALESISSVDGMGFGGQVKVGDQKYRYQFSFSEAEEPPGITGPPSAPQEGGSYL